VAQGGTKKNIAFFKKNLKMTQVAQAKHRAFCPIVPLNILILNKL